MDVYLYAVPAFANDADVMLFDPTVLLPVAGGITPDWFPDDKLRWRPTPIVAESLYHALLRRYGISEGKRIYGLMATEHKGPFGRGMKYDNTRRRKKPPASS